MSSHSLTEYLYCMLYALNNNKPNKLLHITSYQFLYRTCYRMRTSCCSFFLDVYMTLRGTVQLNSERLELLPFFKIVRSSSYTFLRKKTTTTTTTTTKNFLGLGTRNRNSFVSLKAHRFMTRNKRRTVDI